MGIRALRKIEYGLESPSGTAVAATAIWRGTGVLNDGRTITHPEEDIGAIFPSHRAYQPDTTGKLSIAGPLTFEQFPIILSCGVEALETGVQDGTGPYVYDYDWAAAAVQAVSSRTFRGGDNTRVDVMDYGVCTGFTISGKGQEAWQVTSDWIGQAVVDGEFSSPALATVEEALFGKTLFYIDASGGTIGTTAKTSTLLAFTLKVDTGVRGLYTGDGNVATFMGLRYVPAVLTGTLRMEHNATAETEIGIARARAENAAAAACVRLIRAKCQGSAIAGGAVYTNKTLVVDLPIAYTAVPALDDEDGDDVVEFDFVVVKDTMTPQIIVANALSALT